MAKYKSGGSDYRTRAHDRLDSALDKAQDIQEKTGMRLERAKERMHEARDNFKGYVSRNPERAMLIAAGVGAGLGMLASAMVRRNRR